MRFLNVPPDICAMIGASEASLRGEPGLFFRRVHPEDLQVVQASLQHSSANRRLRHVRYRIVDDDGGRFRWIEVKATPQFSAQGKTIWNGQIQEIVETGHDRAYRLDTGRFYLAGSVSSNRVFMVWMRAPDGKLLWASQDLIDFLGIDRVNHLDTVFLEHLHPEDIGLYLQHWRRPPQYAYRFEYRLRRSDGAWRWMIEQGELCNEGGGPTGVFGYCLDAHAFKAMEHDFASADDVHTLFMRREEQRLLAERKEIAQLLHDDIGQMLTAIKLHAFALTSQPELGPDLREGLLELDRIVIGAQKSLTGVTSLIRPPYARSGELPAAIEELVARLQTALTYPIDLDISGLLAFLDYLGNQESLVIFRFVQEALTNAIRHARAQRIVIAFENQEGVLEVRVEDDGVGMPGDDEYLNLSMGLAGLRERAENIGADFRLVSGAGRGTRLTMTLRCLMQAMYRIAS